MVGPVLVHLYKAMATTLFQYRGVKLHAVGDEESPITPQAALLPAFPVFRDSSFPP